MPNIDLSILNQRQTPAFYADTLANRPAAGFVGRIFVSTDTFAFYRDNGTSWDLIGGPGTGTITGSGANGQVSYWNGASTITGSNDLFFDAVNGHLGIGTITPGTALDVKHDQNTVVQLEQVTATNDTRIAFINNGVGLWRLGSFYNAGANDFGLFDIAAATQPVTVKRTTGQVLIGTSTVGSGKLVVASSTGDNGVQIVGASAPSLRIDNAESGPTKRAGFGISTATNNFIQGSADRDFCMFNGSTTASPILFGIYDTTNVQEAARISAARNFLINTTTDAGYKLAVNGTINAAGTIYSQPTSNANGLVVVNGTSGSYGGNVAFQRGGTQDGVIGTQAVNNTIITGATNADICILADGGGRSIRLSTTNTNPQFNLTNNGNVLLNTTVNATGGPTYYIKNLSGPVANIAGFNFCGTSTADTANNNLILSGAYFNGANLIATQPEAVSYQQYNGNHNFYTGNGLTPGNISTLPERFIINSIGNILIGTTTDNGNKLQVNGNAYVNGVAELTGANFKTANQYLRSINIATPGSTTTTILRFLDNAGNLSGQNAIFGIINIFVGWNLGYNFGSNIYTYSISCSSNGTGVLSLLSSNVVGSSLVTSVTASADGTGCKIDLTTNAVGNAAGTNTWITFTGNFF